MNKSYIFLDTWVFSLIRNQKIQDGLMSHIKSNNLTILITSTLMTELYNPGWNRAANTDRERGALAANFFARSPCVIIDPLKVWRMELDSLLNPLEELPIDLDLSNFDEATREASLLGVLRRDDLFLSQGYDIDKWRGDHAILKREWLSSVSAIIDHACAHGNLERDSTGKFTNLENTRDIFLFSLDLRHATNLNVDSFLQSLKGLPKRLTSVHTSSLCFWYSYVDVDTTNRPKLLGSDMVDMFHISLLPYCSSLAVDGTMYKTLQRIRERTAPVGCRLLRQKDIEQLA